jgi:formate hydrogenlyase subunit 3/multisubunit Na+/H+ antiporter MnhD subunit
MLKIQTGVFWGSPHHLADAPQPDDGPDATTDGATTVATRTPTVTEDHHAALRLALPALALAIVTVAFGLGIGPLMDASRIAAEQLADPTGYLDAVAEAAS